MNSKKTIAILSVLTITLILSACNNGTSNSPNNSVKTSSKITQKISQSNNAEAISKKTNSKTQDNIVLKPNKAAKETIFKFYQYLEEKDYKSAVSLLGPQIKFEGKPKMIKYLKNIQKATFHKLIDISNEKLPDLYQYKKYYAVKVYYGEVNFKVKDPNLVPALTTTRYRNIYVIKEKKNDPWKIDMDSETPQRQ